PGESAEAAQLAAGANAAVQQPGEVGLVEGPIGDRAGAAIDAPDALLPPVQALAARARVHEPTELAHARGRGVPPVADDVDEARLGEDPRQGFPMRDRVAALLDHPRTALAGSPPDLPQEVEEEAAARALGVCVEALV